MYTPSAILVLAAAASVSGLQFAQRAPASLLARDEAKGWAVMSSSAPDGANSCGDDLYCPAGTFCHDAQNSQVASCCPSSEVCVGAIQGNPSCADPSWNLFSGIDGNGFCCEVGQVGVIDRQSRTMECVNSGDVGSKSTAVLTKTGSGSKPTSSPSSSSSSSPPETTSTSSASGSSSASAGSTTSSVSSVIKPTSGSNNTSPSANPTPSSTSVTDSNSGANIKQMAMGLVAAGLMLAAAL